ncbi:MAG: hypothetical protein FJ029_10175 [Actinobacteria bacterium]|nr:hypothetical protein [Actinomycetota bacterium]
MAGAFMLAANFGLRQFVEWWRWLPSLLVVLGLWALVRSRFRQWIGPGVIVAIGVAVQLSPCWRTCRTRLAPWRGRWPRSWWVR